MKRSIKNEIIISNIIILFLSFIIIILIITSLWLKNIYLNKAREILEIQTRWSLIENNLYLSMNRWLNGKPFEEAKKNIQLVDKQIEHIDSLKINIFFPKKLINQFREIKALWHFTKKNIINQVIKLIEEFVVSGAFENIENEDKRKQITIQKDNYYNKLNLRELIYKKSTHSWNSYIAKGLVLLNETDRIFISCNNYVKKVQKTSFLTNQYSKNVNKIVSFIIIILIILQIILGILFAIKNAEKISKPILKAVYTLTLFMGQSLDKTEKDKYKDEIALLNDEIYILTSYYRVLSKTAQRLSIGDTSVKIIPKSKNDIMGNAFLGILNYLHSLTDGANELIKENYDYKIEERSEKDILAKTYNKLSKSIESNINEIQGYREHLEQLVIERTAELESANQELKDFAYIVSHDLKAPLRAITQLATWLSTDYKNSLDEKGKEQMDLLIGRAKRMNNLIDGILQYSRVGRIKGIEVEINLDNVLSEIIEMISPPKNIKITVQNELPLIIGDKTRIEQVFQNLIGNAIKFMDKPDGNINIGFSDEDSYWKFWVSDNGIGIDEKHYDKVFQIFQTLISRDVKESTGIGLSIVHKIVEMYGGKIWVESKLGKGSTFYFTLLKKGILKL